MRVSILTSSRADYGIYLPLLKKLKEDSFFDLNIIAFGTHTSKEYGHTLDAILADGFEVGYTIDTVVGSSAKEVAESMAKTMQKFASVWEREKGKTDVIVCLGDRYEMFAAVSASVPFNIPVAHIHGGETTLGAIDNVFRHSLTHMAAYHFTSAEAHSHKVSQLIGSDENVHAVGSLSIDNLRDMSLLSVEEFSSKFGIDLKKPTILVTFHPETVSYERNEDYAQTLTDVFSALSQFQIVITLPNADTMGGVIRQKFLALSHQSDYIFAVENFGVQGYFSAMKHCRFLVGNTSSGIIEAASFQKYVINLGDRQKGRTAGENVVNCIIEKDVILEAISLISERREYKGNNMYQFDKSASESIISVIKKIKSGL